MHRTRSKQFRLRAKRPQPFDNFSVYETTPTLYNWSGCRASFAQDTALPQPISKSHRDLRPANILVSKRKRLYEIAPNIPREFQSY